MTGCDLCGRSLREIDFITECGHIMCGSGCFDNEMCPLCKKKTKFVLIGEQIPSNGTGFLTPIKNICDDTQRIMEVMQK